MTGLGIDAPGPREGVRRSPLGMIVLLALAAVAFVALGTWQVQRLAWKEALIARVDAATHAPPVGPEALPPGNLAAWEYHTVALTGVYQPQGTTLVAAVTDYGPGYWLLEPLRTAAGTFWINRGFMPQGTTRAAAIAMTPQGPRTVAGLLRLDAPHGLWLRANRPAEDRWFTTDLAAIGRVRGVAGETRWFLDARAENPAPAPGGPIPGLTVIAFPNNHLQYALTWYVLAALSVAMAIVLWRRAT